MILNFFFKFWNGVGQSFSRKKKLHLESFLQMQTSSAVVRSTSLRIWDSTCWRKCKYTVTQINYTLFELPNNNDIISKINILWIFFSAFLNIIHLFFFFANIQFFCEIIDKKMSLCFGWPCRLELVHILRPPVFFVDTRVDVKKFFGKFIYEVWYNLLI